MTARISRRALTGLVATAVTAVSIAALPPTAHGADPEKAVSLDDAGQLVGWGPATEAIAWDVPDALADTPFTAVASGASSWSIALTADGQVVVMGTAASSTAAIEDLPTAVEEATITSVTAHNSTAGVVTDAGEVIIWPESVAPTGPSFVPDDLPPATDVSIQNAWAAALLQDGTVRAWGTDANGWGMLDVPEGLSGVIGLSIGASQGYALKSDGTVAAWGRDLQGQIDLPALLTDSGDALNVIDVQARTSGGLALMSDGSLVSWGQKTETTWAPPAGATSVAAIGGTGGSTVFAVTNTGTTHFWGTAAVTLDPAVTAPPPQQVVDAVADGDLSGISFGGDFVVALISTVLEATMPTIAGTPTIDETLTGTPATFSGGPTVTNQWFAGETPILGATGETLVLTDAEVGKQITFVSTATKGAEVVTSTSEPTTAVAGNTVASTTTVSVTPGSYGHPGRATITVNGTGGVEATGSVSVTIDGAAAGTVPLTAGTASLTLPATLTPGAHQVGASYPGSDAVDPSAGQANASVAKGSVNGLAVKVKKLSRTKKGKVKVTVITGAGLAAATGSVKVTVKKGKTKKKATGTLHNGKVKIKIGKLPKKGKWKVKTKYAGDTHYLPAKAPTTKFKVK